MRVLAITARFSEGEGGDGLYAHHLASATVGQGADVHVLTIRDGEYVHLDWSRRSIELQNPENVFSRTLGHVKKNVISSNYYSRTAGRAITDTISRIRPDIIHVHGVHQYFTLAAIGVLRRAKIPSLFTVHDYKLLCGNASFFSDRHHTPCLRCLEGSFSPPLSEWCKKSSLVASAGVSLQMGLWWLKSGLEVFAAFHCGSEFVRSLLLRNPEIRDRLEKVRLPVLHVPIEGMKQQSRRPPEIAYIGRMVAHKGPLLFAQAVRGLQIPKKIYGDGPLMAEVAALLSDDQSARFRGWVTHEAMDVELSMGSIVVVPYLAHETFCYVVLEAMARGCCVVASARGAIPELIQHMVNGVLVREPTADNFRTAITDLLQNPELIYALGENAKRVVFEVPSLHDHAVEMLALYEIIRTTRKA